MAKFLRIRSFQFQCCGSHDISVVPTDPPPPPPPPSKPLHSSLRRHVSSAFTCCACRRRSSDEDDRLPKTPPNLPPLPESEETETLIRSISNTDGGDSDPESETEARRKISLKKKKRRRRRNGGQKWAESPSPARLSAFERLIPCRVEGKVRESFAVVKKSEDPLEDFKRSMMEMITEKEMFERNDLEQLLHCLLSLNDRQFHHIIVQAFSEIWHSLFSHTPTCRSTF